MIDTWLEMYLHGLLLHCSKWLGLNFKLVSLVKRSFCKLYDMNLKKKCCASFRENSRFLIQGVLCVYFAGLKQAMATVNDYNQLMKDFPINDLLSATELDRIRVALQSIFTHLRKIRSTKYPIQRALRLVEAISRDLSTQLLKVGLQCPCSWLLWFTKTCRSQDFYTKLKRRASWR